LPSFLLFGDLVYLLEVQAILIPVYETHYVAAMGKQRQRADDAGHDHMQLVIPIENHGEYGIHDAGKNGRNRHITGQRNNQHLFHKQQQRGERIGEDDEAEGSCDALAAEGLDYQSETHSILPKYSVLTPFPFRGACDICFLRKDCPKANGQGGGITSFELGGQQ